jgi:hypothetical protein
MLLASFSHIGTVIRSNNDGLMDRPLDRLFIRQHRGKCEEGRRENLWALGSMIVANFYPTMCRSYSVVKKSQHRFDSFLKKKRGVNSLAVAQVLGRIRACIRNIILLANSKYNILLIDTMKFATKIIKQRRIETNYLKKGQPSRRSKSFSACDTWRVVVLEFW